MCTATHKFTHMFIFKMHAYIWPVELPANERVNAKGLQID